MIKVDQVTYSLINRIYNNGNMDRATLSTLRSTTSFSSSRARRVWPIILPMLDVQDLSRNGEPTYAENAIFVALRGYAIMQQANNERCANGDEELFAALASLRQITDISEGVDRRVKNLFLSTSFASMQVALIQLIKLLKSNLPAKQVNFSRLAKDLYFYQLNGHSAEKTFLKWGQQYYRASVKNNEKGDK
ncbi:hypothetical protein FC52_GL000698 [Lactobacillus pasteurii DSM 23907 = CRBIP 24.76]|uniref:CRISPR system CASCADE complex protein CasB n=1 Tax=Lactobacillus pasteurii DSM 23907 = CRBIP 24.76 TaxID=1423790 RepID=I7KMI3_9LACO|nr:type I-E CRISPR-associated protein Cse2/CasB [Lactobacillus pasteurii]KRK07374.1 hypothetical protein FC52_GL000698 [Lactobacillus pasteurii DSM 23907 = CRBIP 24.76]TDG77798.1 hypothetical protein C5L33_000022 [Lactobacillus pasteurii]CCI86099.1 CRISPR system CASCADE complex protein CasB [Lactobacillus pasteurii DSM 23907 = CRBIP 24.76]